MRIGSLSFKNALIKRMEGRLNILYITFTFMRSIDNKDNSGGDGKLLRLGHLLP